jgi:hypothetical protein
MKEILFDCGSDTPIWLFTYCYFMSPWITPNSFSNLFIYFNISL